ncbi:MAG: T9SS type A sorting domain-containing protein, partial [Bacteroidota bacterium]
QPEGGTISTTDPTTICAGDGIGDPIDVVLSGESGDSFQWVITDDLNNILALPAAPPFDLDGAGPGTCLIWHLSFIGPLTGAAVGNNVSMIDGCWNLSNPITVIRNQPEGGTISTTDPTTICAGDGSPDPIDVTLEGASGANSAWVITDDLNNIVALPAAPPFDLEGAGGGTCLIWHLSFDGELTGAAVGNNVSMLDGCWNLSNPITVVRETSGSLCVTSTEELIQPEIFNVFPNPVSQILNVEFENLNASNSEMQILIQDVAGRIVYSEDPGFIGGRFETQISVNHLPEGVYILSLRTNEGLSTQKFVKQ